MISFSKSRVLGVSLLSLAMAASVQAELVDFKEGETLYLSNTLTGNVTSEYWGIFNTANYPNSSPDGPGTVNDRAIYRPYGSHNNPNGWYNWSYNGTEWVQGAPSFIYSDLGPGNSYLWKSSGLGYIAGGSLHQGNQSAAISPGGNFVIASEAIAGLETIVFQIRATDRGGTLNPNVLGSVFNTMPTLTFGSTTLSATFQSLYDYDWALSGGGFGPQHTQYWAFQWDLSSYDFAGGEDLSINWTGLSNSGIFELQINQGDEFVRVVPEPASAVLVALGLGVMALRRRR